MPPTGPLRRAPLLDAQVAIALAASRNDVARAAAAELAQIAEAYQSRTLKSAALAAKGRIALAEARQGEAIRDLSTAVMEAAALRMPFEAGTLRIELAAAYRAAGDIQAAELELTAGCRTLEELGAHHWAELARKRAPAGASTEQEKDEPQCCVFRCEGDTRTVSFRGKTVLLKDLKGMRYLERLLAEPNRDFHVLDLVTVERGALPTGRYPEGQCVEGAHSPGLEVFDSQAREAYRRRLLDVEEDIAEAEAHHDLQRAALARADRQFLVDELTRGVGLNGKSRAIGDGVERARTSATRSIRYALDRIARHHGPLSEHLDRTVRTGTYFTYELDPQLPTRWKTSR